MKKTYFNHDSSARLDIRVIKLRSSLSYEGYGLFWAILELLFTEENKLSVDDYSTIAFGLQCDPVILKQVIEDFDLFVIEDGYFYSKRLNTQIQEINSKSIKAKENANKRWNKPSQCDRTASKVLVEVEAKAKLNKSNYYNDISFPDYFDIHYAKRIEQDVNKTKEYHKHLESIGYVKDINNYNGQAKWIKK
tara:strand:- start:75 stop:650 length:576 start_codon:yes stop_codon:yes gene_type:complete